ncbi:MAG: GNAT family N-acetyltransferase [Ilumatobacteraceae bacterium]
MTTYPIDPAELRIVPANQATWDDICAVFGTADYPYHCQCQRLKVPGWLWRDTVLEERLDMHREATACDDPESEHTSGLIAYLGEEAVGWVAVEPRTAYPKLLKGIRVPWTGRQEDKQDDTIWAVTCFCVRKGYRGLGITYALARAAAEHAVARGASAVEGYPMVTEAGVEITWGELYVGAQKAFAAAGYRQVSEPTKRRRVMRLEAGEL